MKAGGDRERIEKELPKHHEIPFDSDRKLSAVLGRFLKTSSMPFADCLLLLALGAIPLMVLEGVKVARNRRHAAHRTRQQ